MNATKLSLAFRDGEGSSCPRDVKTHLQIVTNGPGLAPVTIEPPLPGVASNLLIGTKRVGDQYLGTYETTLKIKDDLKQAYRARAKNGLQSAPATIDVSCLDVASGTLAVKQLQANSCKGEVALSLRSDVAGSVKYRLDCTGDRSWARTIQAHRTGPGTHIAVDKIALEAKNGEQVSCVLKSLAGGQPKIVQLAGHKFECPRAAVSTPSGIIAPQDAGPATQDEAGSAAPRPQQRSHRARQAASAGVSSRAGASALAASDRFVARAAPDSQCPAGHLALLDTQLKSVPPAGPGQHAHQHAVLPNEVVDTTAPPTCAPMTATVRYARYLCSSSTPSAAAWSWPASGGMLKRPNTSRAP